MRDSERSIGIFDSGFGGLTVMRAIRELMPRENIHYFGDTARLPYGSKSEQVIQRYSLENSAFLAELGIKALVIACNTACCAALDAVRKALSIPVIGIIEQGVEETARRFPSGKIALLGTRTTIHSGVYQQHLLARNPHLEILPISCPLFVSLVEEGYIEHPLTSLVIREYLLPIKEQDVQAVLLGCTHYPLLQHAIQQELGPDIVLIDPAKACAEKTRELLTERNLLNNAQTTPEYQFYVSDDPNKFQLLGQTFLGYPIEHVHQKS